MSDAKYKIDEIVLVYIKDLPYSMVRECSMFKGRSSIIKSVEKTTSGKYFYDVLDPVTDQSVKLWEGYISKIN